jgi:hypothetical protein
MFKDRVSLSKEVRDVKVARWEGFRRLAKRLPNHHVLSVELLRTRNDETAAVFTIVRDGRPFQTVVMGDANGRVHPHDCGPRQWMLDMDARDAAAQDAAAQGTEPQAAAMMTAADDAGDTGDAEPDGFAFGGPPPKQPPEPGVIATGTVLLAAAFNLAEQVPA